MVATAVAVAAATPEERAAELRRFLTPRDVEGAGEASGAVTATAEEEEEQKEEAEMGSSSSEEGSAGNSSEDGEQRYGC